MKSIQVKVEEEFQREFEDHSKQTGIKLMRLYKEALREGLINLKIKQRLS